MSPHDVGPAGGTPAGDAELERLASLLRVDVRELAYLSRFDAGALRALRTSLDERIATENRSAYQRIAAASKLMPARATAAVAMKRLPPRLSAAVVGDMPPDHAADLAAAMQPDYLREVCRYLSPTAAHDVTPRLPPDVLAGVLAELTADRDVVTMAEVVGTLDDAQARTCVETFATRDDIGLLVEVSLRISDPESVQRLVSVLPEDTLRAIVEHAEHIPTQRSRVLALLDTVPAEVRQRLFDGVDGD